MRRWGFTVGWAALALIGAGCATADTAGEETRAQADPSTATDVPDEPDVSPVDDTQPDASPESAPTTTAAATDAEDRGLDDLLCEPAREGTSTVLPLPPWAEGQVRELELEIGRTNSLRPTLSGLSLTPVRLLVEQESEDGWSFRWETEPTLLDGLDLPDAMIEQAESAFADLPRLSVSYTLARNGLWLGVNNTDQLRADVLETMDFVGQFFPDSSDEIRALYESLPDQEFARVFTQEPQVFHVFDGIEMTVNEPIVFSDLLPNDLGGRPFPATTTIEIVELVDADGCIAVRMQVLPEPDEAVSILFETLRQLSPETATDEEVEELALGFEIENLIIGQFDQASGYFRRITATQRIGNETDGRVDTKIITDVTPD